MKRLISFLKDEEGATAIEYGLLAALIAIVMAVGAATVGTSLNTMFGTTIAGQL
jgi:pilus assembly protein Flp/PilA